MALRRIKRYDRTFYINDRSRLIMNVIIDLFPDKTITQIATLALEIGLIELIRRNEYINQRISEEEIGKETPKEERKKSGDNKRDA